MITLLKNARLLSNPKEEKCDILFNKSIIAVDKEIHPGLKDIKVIDADGKFVSPGLIDQHTHLIGAGGKFGFESLTPEIMLSELIGCGITSVVGVLGTDGATRSIKSLYAKTKSLEAEGISAFMHTNYFGLPPVTITGSVQDDLIFIDNVLGCKIAISDERGAFADEKDLLSLLRQTRTGGLISGKGGVLHVHLGGLDTRMDILFQLVKKHQFPIRNISPTHVGRTEKLFYQSLEFAKLGGMIDITTGASKFTEPYEQVLLALNNGVSIDNLTFSSDANAGLSVVDKNGAITGLKKAPLYESIRQVQKLIGTGKVTPADAIKLMTVNPAKNLGLKKKGRIEPGFDADFTLFDDNYEITDVIAKGEVFMQNKILLKRGRFE